MVRIMDTSSTGFGTIGIVGATGAVGREMIAILNERPIACDRVRLFASKRSAGTSISLGDKAVVVEELTSKSLAGCELLFFAAGSSISREYVPAAVDGGAVVIDNSSAYRMVDDVPLVVPEVNGNVLDELVGGGIVANPNCSTIIALLAVAPLHRAFGVTRMVVSTYQAASGAGAAAMAELEQQARDFTAGKPFSTTIFKRPYLFNLFSHNSPIGPDGYNEEETKMRRETHKILGDETMAITATCVRVPVLRAHSESINLTFRRPVSEAEAREVLRSAPGVKVVDDREQNRFPEPMDATGQDDVLVGRIRGDTSQSAGMGLNLFVAGDQLRKGAALNAVQIAQRMVNRTVVA